VKTRNYQFIECNGVRLRVMVEGSGPLVVLVHGWPEFWYAFRHQIDPLVGAGYRVAALDVRGYGGSDKPEDPAAYRLSQLAADVAGVITALGESSAVVIGHDWGAITAWLTALTYPSSVRAVVGMSVPYAATPPCPLADVYRALYADRFCYQLYFSEPGVAERELDRDVAQTLRRTFYGASGVTDVVERMFFVTQKPKDATYLEGTIDPHPLPSWLSEEDLAAYVEAFRLGGFRGSLGRYRNSERDFAELWEPLNGRVIEQPALFITGEREPLLSAIPGVDLMAGMEKLYRDLRGKVIIPGVGHWLQQEAPQFVNGALLTFLSGLELSRPLSRARDDDDEDDRPTIEWIKPVAVEEPAIPQLLATPDCQR